MQKAGILTFLMFLLAGGVRGQVQLRSFSPNSGADNVPGQSSLRWSVAGVNLLVNGSFEDRSLVGWEAPADAIAWFNPRPYDGTNVLELTSGAVAQQVTLPQTTSTIMWTFGMTGPFGRFTAQVQSLAGDVLRREDFSKQGRNSSWRGALEITEFAGQTVRLVFDFPKSGSSYYYLDDVRVEVFPEGIEFDVYGFDSQLRWLGRTRGGTWPIPELTPSREYTWRVDAVLNNQTNPGPKLTFRTRASSPAWDLEFVRAPEVVCPDQTLLVEVVVRDTNGFALATPAGLELLVAADNAPPPAVVITEVNVSTNAEIEFANVSEATVDLSRWVVESIERGSFSNPRRRELPVGAKLAPGEIFTLRENEVDGLWPRLKFFVDWTATNAAAVILRDATSKLIDCVFVDRGATNNPGWGLTAWWTMWPVDWSGPELANIETGLTYQRVGGSDVNDRAGWTAGAPNIGVLNPGMSLPFGRAFGRAPATFTIPPFGPPSIPMKRYGVALPRGLSNAVFHARTPFSTSVEGPVGYLLQKSRAFQVPDNSACLNLVGNFAENDGRAPLRIVLGSPAQTDVTVTLSLLPIAFFYPPALYPQLVEDEVTVRAGASEVVAHLDFIDNANLEGPRRFQVRATATGYGDALREFTVRDDDRPQLTLIAPEVVREGEATSVVVESSIAPFWEMTLSVRTEPPSGIASTVKLPGGTNRAEIIVGGYDNILQGDGRMKLIVENLDWTPAAAEFDYVDETTGALSVWWPTLRIAEGATATLTYSMGAKPLTTQYGTLTSSRPDLLPSPGQVEFGATTGTGFVEVTALPADGPDRMETVQVTLSAEGMAPVTGVVEVFIEGEDSGQVISSRLEPDHETLVIDFASRIGWRYTLGLATDVNGPWTRESGYTTGTGEMMQWTIARASYPLQGPRYYRIFREPPPY